MKSCLDCCNYRPDESPNGLCKVAEQPDVKRFNADPKNYASADMSRCPGFREDV